jgi:hypothetical protein
MLKTECVAQLFASSLQLWRRIDAELNGELQFLISEKYFA